MLIIKRNGEEEEFNSSKIKKAIQSANIECGKELCEEDINIIVSEVVSWCSVQPRQLNVEDIQDEVEKVLISKSYTVGRAYIRYRYMKERKRNGIENTTDRSILTLIERNNELVKQENSNKNPIVNSVQRDYMAGEISIDISKRYLLPKDVWEAHEQGIIHFHDADYFAQHMHNCCLINLEDVLDNGTVVSEVHLDTPKTFDTACNISTQVIAQTASQQYGGQSITLSHLAPYVNKSRNRYRRLVEEENKAIGIKMSDEEKEKVVEMRVREEINRGIQKIQYQIITLMTTNGQAPFVTVYMYLNEVEDELTKADLALIIEEMLKQRYKGVKNEKGVFVTPAFPKLIYVLEEDNIREGAKYWYLTELAAKCTAKRMVPDYISEKVMLELKVDKTGQGVCYPCMGCRSFLTPDRTTKNYANANNWKENKGKYYGRFNQGVVTINLVDVACSSGKDMGRFWDILEDRLELCHKALRIRHDRLVGTPTDVAPILWQHGVLARLKKGEVIDSLLYNGYSTISLGYAGLYEMCKYMTGKSHTDPDVKPFALAVMQKLNDKCTEWKKKENIDYSVYGTPIESTTYKFAKCLQKRWGIIPEVTDHMYITNSYHVNVREEIDAFTKLKFESEFQKLSPGGAVSYIEVPNMENNIEAVLSVIQFIYENIMYAELNTKSDYCMECGYSGEIKIKEDNGKLIWECPNCGNRNQSKMSVARRTCGYIGSQFWNQGRTQEIRDRVLHL